LPATANGAVIAGYLGLSALKQLNRLLPEQRRRDMPRIVYPVLPAVWDEEGIAAVPHLGYRRDGEAILPEFRFQPVNPLTRADFTVV